MLVKGQVLAERYRIDRLIGRGGMGAVYQATHVTLELRVAVKELDMGPGTPEELTLASAGFKAEAQILSRLTHTNLPRVHDFFEVDDRQYLVMDYIDGLTLERMLEQRGRFTEDDLRPLALTLCDVLEYLHGQTPPVIFRDLKPSNVMISERGRLSLIDFGIAKIFEQGTGRGTQTFARNVGSPGFAAPEQYSGGTDVRSDIYAFGATMYHLLTGKVPPPSVAIAAGTTPCPPLRSLCPELSVSLSTAIERMMKVRADERLPDIESVRRVLNRNTVGLTIRSSQTQMRLVAPTAPRASQTQMRLLAPLPRATGILPPPTSLNSTTGVPRSIQKATIRYTPPPSRWKAAVTTRLAMLPPPPTVPVPLRVALGVVLCCLLTAIGYLRYGAGRHGVVVPPANYARLIIRARPGVARVVMDGKYRGTTPITVDKLPVGSVHDVTLTEGGRAAAHRLFSIQAGDNVLSMHLAQAPGVLVIGSGTDKMQVFLGRKPIGHDRGGRIEVQLPPGLYRLEFRAPHCVTQLQSVHVVSGHRRELAIHLTPLKSIQPPVTLIFGASGGRDHTVLVDGVPEGQPPLSVPNLSHAVHHITFQSDGYTATRDIDLSGPDQIVRVEDIPCPVEGPVLVRHLPVSTPQQVAPHTYRYDGTPSPTPDPE